MYLIMVLYHEIGSYMTKTRPEAIETELRPLQKGRTNEHALFGEEENQ